MLTSAPFDDWWHNAYGLDVKILSPPHVMLAAGIGAIQCGAMLMALAWQNRAVGRSPQLGHLFLLSAGLLLLLVATLATEYIARWDMHQSLFYQVSAGVFPFVLVSAARASIARWPATTIAAGLHGAHDADAAGCCRSFAAQPLLGPIYVQVDRFMPPDFPLLLIVPALAHRPADAARSGRGRRLDAVGARSASVFVAAFIAVQWPFADFLMTPWARNWFFTTDRMPYMVAPAVQARWYASTRPTTSRRAADRAVLAFVSARCGLWWGNWMARVQR